MTDPAREAALLADYHKEGPCGCAESLLYRWVSDLLDGDYGDQVLGREVLRRAAIQDVDRREREHCLPGWVRDAIREGRQGADPYAAEPCQECGQRMVVARVGRCMNCRVDVGEAG